MVFVLPNININKMLKLMTPSSGEFFNLKCGEVYYLKANTFKITCCICGEQLLLEEFSNHFEFLHLSKGDVKQEITSSNFESSPTQTVDTEDEKPINFDELHSNIVPQQLPTIAGAIGMETELLNRKRGIDILKIEQSRNDDNYDNDDNDSDNSAHFTDIASDNGNDLEVFGTSHKPFACRHCARTFISKHGLNIHFHIMHNPKKPKKEPEKKDLKCEECEEMFTTKRVLEKHKNRIHRDLQCDICKKPFSQMGNMMRHRVRHSGIKAFVCNEPKCDFSFFTKAELNAHMWRHNGVRKAVCEICGKRCRDHGVLTAHMRRHTGERPAKCEICSKSFYSFHDLNIHSVTHTTERPFSCDICSATFQLKKALRVHKRNVHMKDCDRKHKCELCAKTFVQESGLEAHMRSHNGAMNKTILVTALLKDSSESSHCTKKI